MVFAYFMAAMKKRFLSLLLLFLAACGSHTVSSSLEANGPTPTTMDFGMDSGVQDFSAVQGFDSCGDILLLQLRAENLDAAALFAGTSEINLDDVLAELAASSLFTELSTCSIVLSQIYASIGEGYTPERAALVAHHRADTALQNQYYRRALVWSLVAWFIEHPA